MKLRRGHIELPLAQIDQTQIVPCARVTGVDGNRPLKMSDGVVEEAFVAGAAIANEGAGAGFGAMFGSACLTATALSGPEGRVQYARVSHITANHNAIANTTAIAR